MRLADITIGDHVAIPRRSLIERMTTHPLGEQTPFSRPWSGPDFGHNQIETLVGIGRMVHGTVLDVGLLRPGAAKRDGVLVSVTEVAGDLRDPNRLHDRTLYALVPSRSISSSWDDALIADAARQLAFERRKAEIFGEVS